MQNIEHTYFPMPNWKMQFSIEEMQTIIECVNHRIDFLGKMKSEQSRNKEDFIYEDYLERHLQRAEKFQKEFLEIYHQTQK